MKPARLFSFVFLALLLAALSPVHAKKKSESAPAEESQGKLNAATFAGLELREIGPALMSGRVSDIVIHPQDPSTWFVAVGSGGVWKTENSGTTWTSIFDGQGSYSIGCLTIDRNQPNVIWVGTGENVGGRHVGYGDGIYKSSDGGATWENMGLAESEHIGNILIHPEDSNTLYVAVQGPLWSAGGQRGLYKTVDGGSTWENILSGGEYTGVNEVHMDPRDPDVLYAATHQKTRNVAALINGGPESAIHKSWDGGLTWKKLDSGLPQQDKGKIGLAVSPINPDVIYATIELAERTGGFFRSADGGASFTKQNDYISGATGPHYYQEIFASPHHFDHVYQMDNRLQITRDGGKTFQRVGEEFKHGDNHAMAFHPTDPNYLLNGSDGGVYESWDLGKTWKFVANLPVTQFYKVAVDYDEPFYNVMGGTQDNNTQYGPSRTMNVNGIRNSDWIITLFADGHQPAIDPTDPNIIYSEWQEGNLTRYDRLSGEIVYIQPQPEKDEETDRFNWDSPILISPHNPKTLLFASQRVWRSDDRGDSWTAISGDLTRDLDRLEQPMMDDRVWSFDAIWDLWAMSKYGTITSLAQSPLDQNVMYAGTDDGLIQVTEDGGANWRQIASLPGVEDFFFVNDIKADLFDAQTVYVAVDQHKTGDFTPYLFKSTDLGRSWTSIAGDLPERHIVWRMVQDHIKPNLLFAATEFGLFFSLDGGGQWIALSGNAPTISFRDLVIQKRENDLVAASFGRGFWILDDYSALRDITLDTLEEEAKIFQPRAADWYIEKRPLGRGTRATQGASFFIADNPPFGATFTYYLRGDIKTRKQARQESEKELAEKGDDTPYPGWDAIRLEEIEEDPALLFTIRDASNNVIRHLNAPATSGVQRVTWNLRHPDPSPVTDVPAGNFFGPADGLLAAPGTYSVEMGLWQDGAFKKLGERVNFEVESISKRGLVGAPLGTVTDFYREMESFSRVLGGTRASLNEQTKRVELMKRAILKSSSEGADLLTEAHGLERQLFSLAQRLDGNERRDNFGDPGPMSISRRFGVVQIGNGGSTYGPTPTHQRQFEIAKEGLAALQEELKDLVETSLPALAAKLEAAGVPWSAGRPLPSQ